MVLPKTTFNTLGRRVGWTASYHRQSIGIAHFHVGYSYYKFQRIRSQMYFANTSAGIYSRFGSVVLFCGLAWST